MSRSRAISKSADGSAGFSLVELIVVAVVGALLITAFSGFYVSHQRAVRRNEVEIENSQSLRAAMEQMSRDFRLIGRDITRAPGFTRFNSAATTSIDFNIDTNDDGTGEQTAYTLSGSTLQKCCAVNCGGSGYTCNALVDDVTALAFTYYDCGQGVIANPASNLTSIGRIDMSVTTSKTNKVGGTSITRTEADSVTLRNLCN